MKKNMSNKLIINFLFLIGSSMSVLVLADSGGTGSGTIYSFSDQKGKAVYSDVAPVDSDHKKVRILYLSKKGDIYELDQVRLDASSAKQSAVDDLKNQAQPTNNLKEQNARPSSSNLPSNLGAKATSELLNQRTGGNQPVPPNAGSANDATSPAMRAQRRPRPIQGSSVGP